MSRKSSWPISPTGIRSVGQLHDGELIALADDLRYDEGEWFEWIHPPESPRPWDGMAPDYDHEAELAAVPDTPTEEYRQQALDYVEAVLAAREDVRPDSLRPLDDLPTGIVRRTTQAWIWYSATNDRGSVEDDRPVSLASTTDHGKYLFFTPDKANALEEIVIEEFQKRPFGRAKLPTIPYRKSEAVLCLYCSDDRYRRDLRETYQNEPGDETYDLASPYDPDSQVIMPRGFKTDEATRRGEYSEEFKQA
jgi:hypothetical protein